MICSWCWFIHPATAISTNRNGSRTLGIVSSLSRDLRTAVLFQPDPVSGPYGVQFIISARKTSRLVDELRAAGWQRSPRTDADGQCEFCYQREGWAKAYRFIALRYQKQAQPSPADEPEQYQLFDTPEYSYRVFVTNYDGRHLSAGVVLQ